MSGYSLLSLDLRHWQGGRQRPFALPPSKSEAARAVVLALQQPGIEIANLPDASDTRMLRRALSAPKGCTVSIEDAGTAMRFGLAVLALAGRHLTLTGSPRMCERPIGPLVHALRTLGATITYMATEGCPPVKLEGFVPDSQLLTLNAQLSIKADISSQFISALCLAAPQLPSGLSLDLQGPIVSKPYLEMTLAILERFGYSHRWEGQLLHLGPGGLQPGKYHIGGDWSAAAYGFSLAGLANRPMRLLGLERCSTQGDKVVVELFALLGVASGWDREDLVVSPPHTQPRHNIHIDFTDCPDLAQPLIVYCAAQGIALHATGLASLRIKETDRIAALQAELAKVNLRLEETASGTFTTSGQIEPLPEGRAFRSHHDHRMAMSLAPLACLFPIRITEPGVVGKSFTDFWEQLAD